MIVSASFRTDIPALYADWFRARRAAGFALVKNPYGGPAYRVSLRREDVAGYVFWTRNPGPLLDEMAAIAAEGTPVVVQMTVTGYPPALEAAVPPVERALDLAREVAGRLGPKALVWRYDPVLLTPLTPAAWHLEQAASLARALAGASDECATSLATLYAKTQRNLRRAGIAAEDPPAPEKRALLAGLAAAVAPLRLTLCSQPDLLVPAVAPAACVDAGRLAAIAGRPLAARRKGNRPGCDCFESRDIGAYDTCTHGCVYCYAVTSRSAAQTKRRAHDPAAEALG